jgi:hypothetical protein
LEPSDPAREVRLGIKKKVLLQGQEAPKNRASSSVIFCLDISAIWFGMMGYETLEHSENKVRFSLG